MRATDRIPEGWVLIAEDVAHPSDASQLGLGRLLLVHRTTHHYGLWDGLSMRHVPRDWADRQLMERILADTPGSLRRYAEDVLLRDERTVRRWRAGDRPVPPPVVRGWLRHLVEQERGHD